MADYIYLLHTRLTPAQQAALEHVRSAAHANGMTVFLVGGAVRDLTTGSPIRDLDFAIQGDAAKLKGELKAAGGTLVGEDRTAQTLYFRFPGGVRLEIGTTLSAVFPKPGRPVFQEASILDDLRRRDFTANAMAISLNEGSLGLLMDPLNGVADIENRELRLVSGYGFIEDPSRMIRAVRFSARLGWQMEEKTRSRYETGKAEGYISNLNEVQRKYELEEIFHEEDPLRVLKKLESEGWDKVLFPAWTSAKVNEPELERLRDTIGQLESMGIFPDPSAAYFPLLTAKLGAKEVAALKASFARPGFAEEIDALDSTTRAFATQFSAKTAAAPSDAWKLLFSAAPESVLWLAHTTKSAPLQAKFKAFFEQWSQAKQKIPYQLMQEMRITPALPGYDDLIETLFYAVMDGKLDTPEATKAFLEPYSPPAPPVPVTLRRRPAKREPKVPKSRSKKANIEASESAEVHGTAVIPMEQHVPDVTVPTTQKKPGSMVKAAAKSGLAVSVAKAAPVAASAASVPNGKAKDSSPKKTASKQPAKPVAAKKTVPAKPSLKASSSAPAKKVASKTIAKPAAATKKPAKPVKVAAKKAAKPAAQKTAAKKAASPKKVAAKVPLKKAPAKGAKNVPAKKVPAKAKVMPKAAPFKKKPVKVAAKGAKKPATKAKR